MGHKNSTHGRAPHARAWTAVAVAAVLATTTGCQTTQGGGGGSGVFSSQDPCSSVGRNWGVVLGGLGGAVLGKQMGDKQGLVLGAALGAALGGLIGHDIDRRRCELATIAKANQMDLVMSELQFDAPAAALGANGGQAARQASGLSVAVVDRGEQFAAGSAVPTASGEKAFAEMAAAYRRVDGKNANDVSLRVQSMRILLIGHTDDTGSSALNAQLSEARAMAVARIFARYGFQEEQIFYQGAGETLPMADNRDDTGRARNRRVEIVDLSDDLAFEAYLASRRPNTAFYRPHTGQGPYESSGLASTQPVVPVASAAAGNPARGSKAAQAKATPPAKARQSGKAEQPATASASKGSAAGGGRGAAQPQGQAIAIASTSPAAVAPSPAAPGKAAAAPVAARPVPVFEPMDFGGAAVGKAPRQMEVGLARTSGAFSFISSAHASSDVPIGSCLQDRPRISHGVKSLKSGAARTSEYLPGLYNTSWYATVNGHLVALNKVGVLRDGAALANKPELLLYENYKGDSRAKADYRATPEVNTYQGEKGLLYRVFVGGPVQCMDILVPANAPRTAPGSNLIYPREGGYFQTTFAPATAG